MPKKSSHTLDLATSLSLAGMHSAMTLWHRWPILATAFLPQGKRHHAAEIDRIVSEKVGAAVNGVLHGHLEFLRLAGAAMTGSLEFVAMPEAAISIAKASLDPAFRTVKANSRRLGRASRHSRFPQQAI
jgi:hypothetical protein